MQFWTDSLPAPSETNHRANMRFGVPIFLFLATAGFHTALTASLESADGGTFVEEEGDIMELQKRDQMEFEAAEVEAAQDASDILSAEDGNSREGELFLEAVQDESEEIDARDEDTAEGDMDADREESDSESESTEDETDGMRQKRGHVEAEDMSTLGVTIGVYPPLREAVGE